MSDAAFSEIARPALARRHGNGRLRAGFGRRRAPIQDFRQAASSLERTSHGIHGGNQRVHHRLVAELGFAALLHAFDAGLEQRHHVGGRELGLVRHGRSGPQEERAEEGPGAAAHGLDEHRRRVLKDRLEISRRLRGQLRLHRREAAVQTDAEIAVADG